MAVLGGEVDNIETLDEVKREKLLVDCVVMPPALVKFAGVWR
jgi:hypothetical protein